ncbi:MAG: citrate/2-methylcitrate synthase, partial [Gemmatimonadota bacterium]
MSDTVTITDNRTGKQYELPIIYGTYPKYGASISAPELRKIKVSEDDFGMMSYDPAFKNTANSKSSITFIDGERGILHYRGYPIDELAEKSSFLEVAYLSLFGELPTEAQLKDWKYHITHHTFIHENIKKFMDGFHHDAHPMGMLVSTVAALSTFYPESRNIADPEVRNKQIVRLIAKLPTIAAFAYRHSMGLPYAYPDNDLSFAGNFLNMMFKMSEPKYDP